MLLKPPENENPCAILRADAAAAAQEKIPWDRLTDIKQTLEHIPPNRVF